MPLPWLVNYWQKAGKYALPFLKNRKIGLQEKFGDQIIFRRHDKEKNWLYVKNQKDIDKYVYLHTYSFHAHQLSDDNILWFVMDIDKRNDKMPFDLIISATKTMCDILKKDKQVFHLKFSGNRGFHLMWSLGKIKQSDLDSEKIYQFEHQIIDKYTAKLEENIQSSSFVKNFLKYCSNNFPIFSTNSADRHLDSPILIDTNILKRNMLFRCPWSVHPATNLVAAPISIEDLDNFNPANYTVDKVIPKLKKTLIP